ncbi:MAG TPA: alkaline phytoceramidase [Oceanospirillales bacterium]|nr:alkaline phytoceramidase [Oceanospirillales bacterium]
MTELKNNKKYVKIIIWLLCISAIAAFFFIKPIAQDLNYHNFSDKRTIFGIPNFWNVISNLPFLIVGILGLLQLKKLKIIHEMGLAYWILFFGVALVAFGSGYYHLNPNNHTLLWDRLPMTIAFMSLFAIIIAEFVNEQRGSILLFPLLLIGLISVIYWQWTESKGNGDLRLYALVQFLPIIIIPLILISYKCCFNKISGYWWLLFAYVLAKFLEHYDNQIYQLTANNMSGHAIKHLAAAIGMYILLLAYNGRKQGEILP